MSNSISSAGKYLLNLLFHVSHVSSLVCFVAQSSKPIHHETRNDVEEQDAHDYEEAQIKEHARNEVGVALGKCMVPKQIEHVNKR